MITRPSPAHTSHSGLAATAKSAPAVAIAAPATEPHSATPTLTPTCRLVEATAEAAPALSAGRGHCRSGTGPVGRHAAHRRIGDWCVHHREADAEHREDHEQLPNRG